MQEAIQQLNIIDPRLAIQLQIREIPHFEVNGLTNFQRMFKCLLECFAKPLYRANIYMNVVNHIQLQVALPVTPFSILICTSVDIEQLGAIRRKGSVILEFAMAYVHEFEEMEDSPFLERLMDINGIGYYTAFRINLFGRRRFNYFPAGSYTFRRALCWFRQHRDGIDPHVTLTPQQAIDYSWMWQWQPRRGIAAYIIWATAPIR